jgi:hypothetical protein
MKGLAEYDVFGTVYYFFFLLSPKAIRRLIILTPSNRGTNSEAWFLILIVCRGAGYNIVHIFAHLQAVLSSKRFLSAGKELLALGALFTLATRTPEAHLLRTSDPTLQMFFGDISKRLNENWATIQRLGPFNRIRVTTFSNDFFIKFIQSLDVIRCECNRNEDQIGLTFGDVVGDRIRGLRSQPCRRSNLGLPY